MDPSVAIITGAGRGIGRAAAIELAARGFKLALASRTENELAETAQLAANSAVLPTDVADPRQVDSLIGQTLRRYGRIDAVVHCAGYAPSVSVETMTDDQWRSAIDINLSSAFYLARAAWPTFRAQQSGVIVHISSFSSRDPFPGFAAYGAAKAALNIFSLVLAREAKEIGVRVHTIAPGAVETGMFRALMSEQQWPDAQGRMGRDIKTLEPADVARVIAGCVNGDLRHTSGEVIFLSK